MKMFPWIVLCVFLEFGVFAIDGDEVSVSVKEGDSVTLNTDVTINPKDRKKWYFNEILIAEITGDQSKICTDDQCDERFRDRLKLDHQTGSLTIMNTTNTHTGLYQLEIISSGQSIISIKSFSVTVTDLFVMEGDSVTLHTGVKIKQEDGIRWFFNGIRIAQITGDQSKICTDDQCDGRFRDRLKLDHQTGSLTIMNTTTEHTGVYQLKIFSNSSSINRLLAILSVKFTAVSDSGLSAGAVAGIVVVVLLLVSAVSVAAVIHYRKRHTTKRDETTQRNDQEDPVSLLHPNDAQR